MTRFIWISCFLVSVWKSVDCSCTFPSEIEGVWYSAHKGALTFNSTHVTGYPIYMSFAVQSLDFTCYQQSDRKYLLRATETALVFGQDIRGYLCIELWRVSSTKYYYYLGTSVSFTNNDNIYGRVDAVVVDTSTACNQAEPYTTGAFIMLVKDGEVSSGGAEATCPTDLLAKFSSVSITDSTGSTSCSGSSVDVCTDRTEMNYTIDASCGSSLKFSSGNYWVCLHSISDGSYQYLAVWNNDTTVDGSTTYRFTCYAISSSGGTVYATVHPNYCSDSSQTPTSVPSPGTIHVYSGATEICYEEVLGGSSGVYYATIVIGVFFLISLVILFICLYKKGCCAAMKRRCQKRPTSATSSTESSVDQGDQVTRPVFSSTAKKLKPIPGFKAKRPLRIGPIVEPSLEPLPKVEPLYAIIDPMKKQPQKEENNAEDDDEDDPFYLSIRMLAKLPMIAGKPRFKTGSITDTGFQPRVKPLYGKPENKVTIPNSDVPPLDKPKTATDNAEGAGRGRIMSTGHALPPENLGSASAKAKNKIVVKESKEPKEKKESVKKTKKKKKK